MLPRSRGLSVRFLTAAEVAARFEGRSVAIVGSGPGVLANPAGLIDGHDVVVRINNYKLVPPATGARTDVFASFFGTSIRKAAADLKRDGVTLCLCKCPNAHALQSEWHRRNGMMIGVDYRPHYRRRAGWWFCDTYIPSRDEFVEEFMLLDRHIPTTGFATILKVLKWRPAQVYLTGFDFFRSGIHNVDECWRKGRDDDPIRHVPDRECRWLADHAGRLPLRFDAALEAELGR